MAENQITVKLMGPEERHGRVELEHFAEFCQSVARCLRRSEQIVSGSEPRIHYVISGLECSGATVRMQALRPAAGPDTRRQVLAFFNTAVKTIQGGEPDQRLGPDDVQMFGALANPLAHGLKAVVGRTTITEQFTMSVKAATESSTTAEGFVTGILDKLNLHNKTELVLYLPIGNQQVTCTFEQDMLTQIRAALKRNVTVRGRLHYRSGKLFPHRVDAKSMRIHDRDIDLPTLHDVRAHGPWDTGGLSAVDFVRAIRDEQD